MHYSVIKTATTRKRWLFWYVALFTVLICSGLGFYFVHRNQPAEAPSSVAARHTDGGLSSHDLFVGDVFWGRQVQTRAEASGLGYEYTTSGLKAADRANYDGWVANFECPITTHNVPYAQQVATLTFNCRPEYLPNFAKWFSAVTLANNHTGNNGGQQGLIETRSHLQQNGIQYTGNYDMTHTGDICEVVSLPAKVTGSNKATHLPVALCGFMYVVDATPTNEQLAVMKAYAKVMPVIAMPHMGVEYRSTAEPEKVLAYHRMIDNGADVVIGAHPHVIQNSENYKGRLIAYSVGNFLFDQQTLGRNTTLGLGVDLTLQVPAGAAATAYQRVADQCSAYKDNCLQQLQKTISVRPKISVSYDFRCFDISSNVPVAGNDQVCNLARQQATTDKLSGLAKVW